MVTEVRNWGDASADLRRLPLRGDDDDAYASAPPEALAERPVTLSPRSRPDARRKRLEMLPVNDFLLMGDVGTAAPLVEDET